jgi:hypothetical protein
MRSTYTGLTISGLRIFFFFSSITCRMYFLTSPIVAVAAKFEIYQALILITIDTTIREGEGNRSKASKVDSIEECPELSCHLITDPVQILEYDDYMYQTHIHYLMNQLQYHVENQTAHQHYL